MRLKYNVLYLLENCNVRLNSFNFQKQNVTIAVPIFQFTFILSWQFNLNGAKVLFGTNQRNEWKQGPQSISFGKGSIVGCGKVLKCVAIKLYEIQPISLSSPSLERCTRKGGIITLLTVLCSRVTCGYVYLRT